VKGRFLAEAANADLIISIGDPSAQLISAELEDIDTFFISAGALSGNTLAQPNVAGILSYSPEETIRVAQALLPDLRVVGALYTPGYEGVVSNMEAAAQKAGITLTRYQVKTTKEIGPKTRNLVSGSDLLWVAGDPLLTQDLIFSYVLQQALQFKKPVVTPLSALVGKGALFCTVPDDEMMSRQSSLFLAQILAAGLVFPKEGRIQPGPSEGFVIINRQLADRWNIHVPSSLRLVNEPSKAR
jgi:ABC-type uncharacterized transport system substrate-binding protein